MNNKFTPYLTQIFQLKLLDNLFVKNSLILALYLHLMRTYIFPLNATVVFLGKNA